MRIADILGVSLAELGKLAMAADLVDGGVRVNCVVPGTADTPWVGRLLDAADDPAGERAALEAAPADPPPGHGPRGRRGDSPTWRGPGAASTTGTGLVVDGGLQDLRLRR